MATSNLSQRLVNEHVAAKYLNFSPRALQNWRVRGGGPRFVKINKRSVRYRICDLDAWVQDKLRGNTSES